MDYPKDIPTFSNLSDLEEFIEDYVFESVQFYSNTLLHLPITPRLFASLCGLNERYLTRSTIVYYSAHLPVCLYCERMDTRLGQILWGSTWDEEK